MLSSFYCIDTSPIHPKDDGGIKSNYKNSYDQQKQRHIKPPNKNIEGNTREVLCDEDEDRNDENEVEHRLPGDVFERKM